MNGAPAAATGSLRPFSPTGSRSGSGASLYPSLAWLSTACIARHPDRLIGPGTGIAPFRAFLQERQVIGARGRNWLLFGNPHRRCDFLFEEELTGYCRDGLLTRLDLAFSRDQQDKVYVQHRLLEHAAELWAWLEGGAHLYLCGDAQRMARDVEAGLAYIIAKAGRMDGPAARAYLARLGAEGRYQKDVY